MPGEFGATAGNVADAVAVYGADQVHHALDVVERRNRKAPVLGRKPVESWGFVLGILDRRKREGWVPPDPQERPAVKVESPGKPLPHLETAHSLTEEQVAELVALCQAADPRSARMGRAGLRQARRAGTIPPELVPTIPPGILDDS